MQLDLRWEPWRCSRLLREQLPSPPLRVEGTTLESTDRSGLPTARYRQLTTGPPQPIALRTELAPAGDEPRRPAGPGWPAVVQLTDLHVTDVQNPLRFEYLDRRCRTGHRPQELLGTHGAAALVRRVNSLRGGSLHRPADRRGDDDGRQHRQPERYPSSSGCSPSSRAGVVHPDSGGRDVFDGVAGSDLYEYWQPESPRRPTATRSEGFPAPPRPDRGLRPGRSTRPASTCRGC